MSLHHGWGWQPLELLPASILDSYKVFEHMICCPWAYSSSLTQLYQHYLAHSLGFWVTCGVKMVSLRYGRGWQPPQTSCILIRDVESVWAHWYAVHWHMIAALHSYTHCTWYQILQVWVICEFEIMPLHQGWGWHRPPQTSSCIHVRHVECVWAHWLYAIHWHTVGALNRYAHTTCTDVEVLGH
jgi:hypothetical protein